MRCLKSLVFFALAGIAAHVAAEDVPYFTIKTCDLGPYKSQRDYWDQTQTFCFERDNIQYTYPISSMGEVKLREDGKTLYGEYFDALDPENRRIVSEYKTYYVRYLALGDAAAGQVQTFVTHVFFNWGGATQTIYVFGEIDATGGVRLTGFSSSNAAEREYRTAYNTLKNIFAVFRGRSPAKIGEAQARDLDRRRIRPVTDVVEHFKTKSKVINAPKLPLP